MPSLAATAFAMMVALSPPASHRPPPGWAETPQAIAARYHAIAEDIAAVARNRVEVAYLVGVGAHESAFAADVDRGACYRVGAWASRCDGGRAVSAWQLQERDPERRELYRTNRRAAAREALRRIIGSAWRCIKLDPSLRLAAFASGTCEHGWDAARSLYRFVRRALSVAVPPET